MYRVATPYIVADGEVTVQSTGARVTVETDRGNAWAVPRPGASFKDQGPVGRYGFLTRVRLADGAAVSALAVKTIVQLNSLALPSLLAGENKITVSGALAKGQALDVTYVWDDLDGKERKHVARAAALPYTYTILAAGKTWQDVKCRSVTVRAVADDGKGNRVLTDVPKPSVMPSGPLPSADVRTVIGPNPAPPMKTCAEFVKDLASDSADVRRLAAQGLTILRDPAAWDALAKVATDDTTVAKICAVQALFWTDRERAAPLLRKVLTRDASVKFEPTNDEMATYSNVAGTIAAMCGLTKFSASCRSCVRPRRRWARSAAGASSTRSAASTTRAASRPSASSSRAATTTRPPPPTNGPAWSATRTRFPSSPSGWKPSAIRSARWRRSSRSADSARPDTRTRSSNT